MAAAELGLVHRDWREGVSWPLRTDAGIVTSFTPVPSFRMGLEVHDVISSVSNDLQNRVGQSLTFLAVLSTEETPGSVWAPSLRVIWTHSASPLLYSSEYWGQLSKSIFRSLSLVSSRTLKASSCHCEIEFVQEIRCRLFHMQGLISVPGPTAVLSRWNPVLMGITPRIDPKFLCSCLICHSVFISVIDAHWHKASWFLRKRKIQDSTNQGRVGSSLISMGRASWCLYRSFSPKLHLFQASCLHVTCQGLLSAIHP